MWSTPSSRKSERRSKLGLAAGLGLGLLGYAALVASARRLLVSDPPLSELEASLQRWLGEVGLEAWDRYVHTPVGRVHVLLAGRAGSPLILLPGLGASGGDFGELLARLATRHRVAAIDLPGSGLSDPVSFQGHPRQAWDQLIGAVVDELGVTQFNLVGHSLGGLAAGSYATAHPERVGGLVLISPLGLSRRIPLHWNLSLLPGILDLLGLYERYMLTRGNWNLPEPPGPSERRVTTPARSDYRRRVGLRFGHDSDLGMVGRVIAPFGLRPESQLLPGLGLLGGRTLVLWGGHDRRLAVRDVESELRYFKGLRLEVVPGAGHLLPVVEPNLTARLITEFLGDPTD